MQKKTPESVKSGSETGIACEKDEKEVKPVRGGSEK